MKMVWKKIVIVTALAMSAVISSLPVYADYVSETDGKIYGYNDEGEILRGWKTINGKMYCFKSDGSAVKGVASVGGAYYKFSDEGICLGKITGWIRRKGKRIYLSKGKTLSGWQRINNDFYYFYEDGSAATGTTILFGNEINFSDKGVWDMTWPADLSPDDFLKKITENINNDNYAGSVIGSHGILTLYFKNPALYADQIEEWRKIYPFFNIEKADYSLSELQFVADELKLNKKKFGITVSWIQYRKNRVSVEAEEINDEFRKYIDSLDDPDILDLQIALRELYYEDE